MLDKQSEALTGLTGLLNTLKQGGVHWERNGFIRWDLLGVVAVVMVGCVRL